MNAACAHLEARVHGACSVHFMSVGEISVHWFADPQSERAQMQCLTGGEPGGGVHSAGSGAHS